MSRPLRSWPALPAAALIACLAWALPAAAKESSARSDKAAASQAGGSPEDQLLAAIDRARQGDSQESLRILEALLRRQPNFRLAQLLYGDILAARSGHRGIGADREDPRVQELIEEERLRLAQAKAAPPPGTVPDAVLQLSREYPYLVLVDLPRARLHLLRNADGHLQPIGSRYAAMGRAGYGKQASGDLRTPVGVYHVTGWMSDQTLPALYGIGALPLNYPNLWDRFKAKTGYGIWLHGVPRETYVRAPRSSEGCVTMANEDLLWLKPYVVKNRAPVVLADKLEWIPEAQARKEREAFVDRIQAWRESWEAMDTNAYLAFYGDDFATDGMSKAAFADVKRRMSPEQKAVKVKLDDLSLFRYPGEPMFLAEFTLDYRAGNAQSVTRKEQYWRQDAKGVWKIFREENR